MSCRSEIEQLKGQIAQCDKQIEDAKLKYFQALTDNLKKDVVIEGLAALKKNESSKYDEFSGVFSKDNLDMIRSIGTSKRQDPLFVREAVHCLYANNLSALQNKSLSGKSKDNSKTKITPSKRKILEKLYNRRLEIIEGEEMVEEKRKTALANHIKSAIKTINKKTSENGIL